MSHGYYRTGRYQHRASSGLIKAERGKPKKKRGEEKRN